MAGYSISEMVKPRKDFANIEAFFTLKGQDLFCISPAFKKQFRIRDFNAKPGASASILGLNKSLPVKNTGKDCIIDLSGVVPGEISSTFVVKLSNTL